MERSVRPIIVVIAALAAASFASSTAQAGTAVHYHTVLRATGKVGLWTSRPVRLQRHVRFREESDCTSYPRKQRKFFRAALVRPRGESVPLFNTDNVEAGQGTGTDRLTVAPGRYRLRVTTSCTFAAWHVMLATG
jgi:hypothetical protein